MLGLRAVRRYGVWQGLGVLRLRLKRCREAHRSHLKTKPHFGSQAGYCDLPCDGFDADCAFESCDCAGSLIDLVNWDRSKASAKREPPE